MGRKVDVEDLVGATEIVERLNLKTRHAVRSWRLRCPDFPPPVAKLATGPIWAFSDIVKWAEATGHARGYRYLRG